ncbi:MAG: hypothetical protein E7Z65_06370 [Thermoplasmata archaeon]|nr:hypothetical protein [Thermoplasmata archaeon]
MRAMAKKRPTEAEVNYRFVGSATKSIHGSVKKASRDLQDDYGRILQTYTEKGGFSSRQEALDYMNGHVQPEGYKALVERARKLPEPDRTRELTRLSTDAYKFRMSRTKACDIAQGYHARMLQEDIRKDLGKAKAQTAITASEQTLFNAQKATGSTGIGFDLPNTEQIKQIAYGTTTEKKIKLFSDNEMKSIRGVMDAGILSGRSYDQIAKEAEKYTDNEFYKVRRLVRTEMAQASVDAEMAEMEELGYEEYEVHCTLDEKTCEICGSHDGKVYKMGDEANMPTYHPNCRCYITPVMKKEGRTRSARNEKGKSIKVPANMTYQEWRKQYAPQLEVEHKKFEVLDKPMATSGGRTPTLQDDYSEGEFSEIKTHCEFYSKVHELLGEDIVLDKKNLKNCDMEVLSTSFNEIHRMMEATPVIRGSIGKIIVEDSDEIYAIRFNESPNEKATLVLGKAYFENKDTMKDALKYDVDHNFHPPGTTPRTAPTHDMTHLIEAKMICDRFKTKAARVFAWENSTVAEDVLRMAFKEVKSKNQNLYTEVEEELGTVSRYAKTDFSEGMAECVLDVRSNGNKAKPLSKAVVNILRGLGYV